MADNFKKRQEILIEDYIKTACVNDKKVLLAMRLVPRHKFVPKSYQTDAYLDIALPIGKNQTISQPSLVGLMLQTLKLKGRERVLDIGTGSGYQAAILSLLAKEVYSVEIIKELADSARKKLISLGYSNVHVINADGSKGLESHAPYNAIIVAAAAPSIPNDLINQLKNKGKLIVPVGQSTDNQILKLVTKKDHSIITKDIEPVVFVPLITNKQSGKI